MLTYFLNPDHTVRECTLEEWSEQLEEMRANNSKHIAYDKINGWEVSTVWLGLNHNYWNGAPILFETMVFDKDGHSLDMDRYSTWDEAVEGHKKAIQWVLEGCNDDE